MTTSKPAHAVTLTPTLSRRERGRPVFVVLAGLLLVWFAASIVMNYPQAAEDETGVAAILATQTLDRPLLPAPQQVMAAVVDGLVADPATPRSLIRHAAITVAAAAAGFGIALVGGGLLALGIVHSRTLDRALLPWVVASQTVPILAIAPMLIIVLGAIGLTGLVPKALIAGWLSFFPITMALVQGLRAPDAMQMDLMHTYAATPRQILTRLRWPMSLAYLFPGLKLAATLCLVGAIVAELPTGAQAGLGARLLAGSYYGQPLVIWSALVMAAALSLAMVGLVHMAQTAVSRRRGGRL